MDEPLTEHDPGPERSGGSARRPEVGDEGLNDPVPADAVTDPGTQPAVAPLGPPTPPAPPTRPGPPQSTTEPRDVATAAGGTAAAGTTTDTTTDTVTTGRRILVTEPPLPRRTRRPRDAFRLIVVITAIVGLIIAAVVAERTLTGLTLDLAQLRSQIPDGLFAVVDFLTAFVGLALPPVLVVMLMLRGRLRTTAEVLVAGVLAAVAATVATQALLEPAADPVENVFVPGGTGVPAYPALLIAVLTVVSRLKLRRLRQAALFAIVGSFAVSLFDGFSTVGGTLIAVGIGLVVGLLVRLVSGQPSVAPDGQTIARTLRAAGYPVTELHTEQTGTKRRYRASVGDRSLDVLALDRDEEGSGLFGRIIDIARTRDEVLPRNASTLREATERVALMSMAIDRAGARTPALHGVVRVSSDATVLVFDHVPGRTFGKVAPEALTDAVLEDLWRQVAALRAQEMVHRRLVPSSLLLDDAGAVWLLDHAGGELGATDLALRTDLAQALVTSALLVGVDRTVRTAVDVLGKETVGAAVAVLQRVALTASTRRALRADRSLLSTLRNTIVRSTGTETEEVVQLRRVRPLSLVTGVAAVAALYLVGTQLADVQLGDLIAQTDWRWLLVAVAAVLVSYLGAAYALLGFVPEKVPLGRTIATQVALSFLRLVAPSAVGNVAVNIRMLTRAGVDGPLAAASVAANQVGNVAITVPMIATFAVLSGSSAAAELDPSPRAIGIAVAAVAALGLLALIPRIRRWLVGTWRSFAERGLPRLFDVLSNPRKLGVAIGGITVQLLALVAAFYACVRAVGTSVEFTALAVVQLVGNTVGMAVPTPGGLGAVEAALSAGVSTIGVGAAFALPSVLLFRIVSFWLPILPGWICWTQLQRRQLV